MSTDKHEKPQEIQVSDAHFRSFGNEDGCWYESEEDVSRGLALAQHKADLLRWVRKEMNRRLTPRERTCFDLYYFESLTLREVGDHTGTSTTSAMRAIRRATRKLRRAARDGNLALQPRSRGR